MAKITKLFGGNTDEALNLVKDGTLDFKELETVTVKSISSTKSIKPTELHRLETLSGNGDARAVGDIMRKMKAGQKMEPIEVFVDDGKKYVLDGHHRMEAATRLGQNIEYKELSLEQAMSKFEYKSKDEILNAAAEAGVKKNKLSNKVINKIASSTE